MKRTFRKAVATVLTFLMVLVMLCACGKQEAESDIYMVVDAAVKTAMEAAVISSPVTFEADGRQVTIEDTEGKSLHQLLEMAEITLNDGDVLTVNPVQTMAGTLTIRVSRSHTVTITVTDEETTASYTVVLLDGTVADAIAAAGLELTGNWSSNCKPDQLLEDGMQILISADGALPQETEPEETTEPTDPADEDDNYDHDSDSDDNDYTPPSTTTPPATTPPETTPPATTPPETTPPATTPPETTPSKTVVSVEIYEDCDGSGHGIKVITYSDGTQEEVVF